VLYWQLSQLGVACEVVARTLVPVKAGDRVKTDRRDAIKLAGSYLAGELTAVWVPDGSFGLLHGGMGKRRQQCLGRRRTRRHDLEVEWDDLASADKWRTPPSLVWRLWNPPKNRLGARRRPVWWGDSATAVV
jgi:hypothetical protein